jgi:hypothetical protein
MAIGVQSAPDIAEIRPWVAPIVRLGYAAKGLIYTLVGLLAFRLAVGLGGRITDASGVLQAFVPQPFGRMVLAAVGTGLLAYGVWHGVVAVVGRRRNRVRSEWIERGLMAIKGFVYGSVGWEALQLVFEARAESPSAEEVAHEAMQVPFGDWLILLVGIGVASYGLAQIWMAWTNRFDEEVDVPRLRREGLAWMLRVGRAGVGARGLILMVMGLALVRAGVAERASQASGMAESLWTLFAQPYGDWLLAATGAGLVCYGAFEVLNARYARV